MPPNIRGFACVTTWPGGTGGVGQVDLAPLAGKRLVLIPDNDELGIRAMRTLRDRLADLAAHVEILAVPADLAAHVEILAVPADLHDIAHLYAAERDADELRSFDLKTDLESAATREKFPVLDLAAILDPDRPPVPLEGIALLERARAHAERAAGRAAKDQIGEPDRRRDMNVVEAHRDRLDARFRQLRDEYGRRVDEFVPIAVHADRLDRAHTDRVRIEAIDAQVRASGTCPICARYVGGIEAVRRDVSPRSPWITACADCRSILAAERARLARLDIPAAAVAQLEQLAADWRSTQTSDRPRSS